LVPTKYSMFAIQVNVVPKLHVFGKFQVKFLLKNHFGN
jgi:hypothetical protein